MHARAIGAGVATLAALVLSGCAGQDEQAGGPSATAIESPAPTAPAGGRPSANAEYDAPPAGTVNEDTGEIVGQAPVPTWDHSARVTAVEVAEQAMAAFARPDLDHESWWAQLVPLLDRQAQQDYAYVDPSNIPARATTGAGALVDDDASAYLATVVVPTDVGDYTVLLTRTDGATPWLVSRFTPADQGE